MQKLLTFISNHNYVMQNHIHILWQTHLFSIEILKFHIVPHEPFLDTSFICLRKKTAMAAAAAAEKINLSKYSPEDCF